jgi:hypothetical protein
MYFGLPVLAMVGALACSHNDDPGTMTLQATVDPGAVRVDNARAVAVSTSGDVYWAYLDRQRDFTLALPVGTSYRVFIANQMQGGGQSKVARVIFPTSNGSTEWIGANNAGAVVDAGLLQVDDGTSTATGGTKIQCHCGTESSSGDKPKTSHKGESNHKDDYPCHHGKNRSGGGNQGGNSQGENDDDQGGDGKGDKNADTDVCIPTQAAVVLVPSDPPGDDCADHDADKHGGDGGAASTPDDEQSCKCKGRSDSGRDDDDDDDDQGEDNDHQGGSSSGRTSSSSSSSGGSSSGGSSSSSSSSGGSSSGGSSSGGSSSSTSSSGGSSSGGASEGSSCSSTKSCTSNCSCVASTCLK